METKVKSSTDETVRELLSEHGTHETHRLIGEYNCHRKDATGRSQNLRVRVWDMGPENPNARYSWEVWVPGADCDAPIAGNPADSVYAAGMRLHWDLLDADARRDRR